SQWRVVAPFSEIRQFAYLIRHFLTSGSALLKGVEANLQPGSRPILHANDLDALVPAVLIKLRHGGSVIYDAHEFYPVQFVDPSKWFVWCFKWIERKCIAHCGEVFSVTPQLAQAMADTYSSPKPYGYVPNASPIDPGPLPLIKTDLPLKFIFQGNFTRGRGLSQLVRFWNQINTHGAHLYLRGPDSALKLELIEDARRHGTLDKSVFFLTPVQELDLISSLEGFDVGVIPYEPVSINNRYCCPNKLSQYMQAGLAILCNDLEFVKSVVNKYGCGKSYDATDRQTFEEAVRWWSAHPEELHKMKERGRAAALKEYNWETEGQKFVEAYDRVSMSSSS
ncbi:MAG TPA: glycosyltransferase, partial [Bdellovibrionales bacterium]|nr:glycosyltransferase [Bdellovibrionales bacterium]